MQIISAVSKIPVSAVLFDFDGTISTLRYGWDKVMRRLMLELIEDGDAPDPATIEKVDKYLDESAGIQTIYQMKWLMEQVNARGKKKNPSDDPWWYKDEYNNRLMQQVSERIERVETGSSAPDAYLMAGAVDFLQVLAARGIPCYVASGTDDKDVRREAGVLGVDRYFQSIAGAPARVEGCAKEAALRMLVKEIGLESEKIAVIGDGKVEIQLARAIGARALGLASNEAERCGIDEIKRTRLVNAGASAIVGDYLNRNEILAWLGLEED